MFIPYNITCVIFASFYLSHRRDNLLSNNQLFGDSSSELKVAYIPAKSLHEASNTESLRDMV